MERFSKEGEGSWLNETHPNPRSDDLFWLVVSIIALVFGGLVSSLFSLLSTGVPVLRTAPHLIADIKKAIGLREGQVLADLGCADARTLISLLDNQMARGRGYELNGPIWLAALVRVLWSTNRSSVSVHWRDFFRADLDDVDHAFCYLMPGLMRRVYQKCQEEMPEGSFLYSLFWPVPDCEPFRCVTLDSSGDSLYIYRINRYSTTRSKT